MKSHQPSPDLFRTAVSSAPIILWTADLHGIVTLMEGRGLEGQGIEPGQMVGQSLITHFEGRPEMQARLREALAGEAVRFESEAKERAYEHWIEPIRDPAGEQVGIVGTTIEVTDRYKAESERARSEEQFRALAEGSVQGIVIHRGGRILFANQAYATLFGYASPEEVCALPGMHVVIAPDQQERLKERAGRIAAGEKVPDVHETAGVKKDGTRVELMVFSRTVRWQGEQAIQSTLVDITERKRVEEALQASQRLLSNVFDAIPHPTVVKGKHDEYLMVNRAWTELLGHDLESLRGRTVADWPGRPQNERTLVKGENTQVLSGAVPRLVTERYITLPNGEQRYVQVLKEPLHDASGEVTGLISLSIDLTDRKRAEADLREKEWMLNRAQQAAHIGTWFRELHSGKLRWSEETYRICGVDPLTFDASKSGYADLIHPEDRTGYLEARDRVAQNGGSFRHEHRMIRPDGETRIVLVIGERYGDADGNPVGIIGIFQDITHQRMAEARLIQGEKMEAVGRLTAGVAHDFNNLLTVIRGNLELLMRSVSQISTAKPLVESVLAAADRGVGLVRQLAAVARKQPLQPTIMSVSPVLTGLTSLLERTLGPSIKINTAINEDTWTVRIDTAQLQSAVLNLAINARDAMRDGGELTLSAENRSVGTQERAQNPDVTPGDYVMVSVIDTGTGIPDAVRNKVFEPFFTTKEPGKGTGLGLSMVHGFVRQSGGYVSLESEVGVGTTIRLYFPRASMESTASFPDVNTAA